MDRSQYLQEWNFEPERQLPADAAQPWLIAGYSFKAVDSDMKIEGLASGPIIR